MGGEIRLSGRDALRRWWEERIPTGASSMLLRDAHRIITAAAGAEIISLRTLQRRTREGALRALGGTGTALRNYRVPRAALVDYLAGLDGFWVDGDAQLHAPEPDPDDRRPRDRAGERKRKQARLRAEAERALREQRERRRAARAARLEAAMRRDQLTLWEGS
jgi:hypothetical protein